MRDPFTGCKNDKADICGSTYKVGSQSEIRLTLQNIFCTQFKTLWILWGLRICKNLFCIDSRIS